MIVFNLACSNDHRFEGWFASITDFEQQQKSELLNCPVCGVHEVTKVLHAPYVNTGGATKHPAKTSKAGNMLRQCTNASGEVARIFDYIIANTEDVGSAFPEEARKIHYREVPERKIRGSASTEEVNELQEEGIDVMVLPAPSHRFSKAH